MKVILLTSDYYLAGNVTVQNFLEHKSVRSGEIKVAGVIAASTFAFDKPSWKKARRLIRSAGLGFFLKTVAINTWQTYFTKAAKYIWPKHKRRYFEVEELCEEMKIPFLEVRNINGKESKDFIKKMSPDLLVSCLLLQILKKSTLVLPRKGSINFHPALFKHHRGSFSGFWALLKNRRVSGATVHFMTEKIDEGEVILQKRFFVQPSDTIFCVNKKCAQLGGDLLAKAVVKIEKREKRRVTLRKMARIFSIPTRKEVRRFEKKGKEFIKLKDLLSI